jgi:tetratricopeptide (TPR) repeat protein
MDLVTLCCLEWTLNEQVAIAAMDCQCLGVAQSCIKALQTKFPGSKRVGRLEALLLEAKGLWGEAEEAYASLLEDNPLDQAIHKRRVAISKALGKPSIAIELLNKYLELFMADHDAWRELAELYLSLQMYKQAAFCYEELILSQPTVPLYHLAYAEVSVTSLNRPHLIKSLNLVVCFSLRSFVSKSGSLYNRWSRKHYLSKKILCSDRRFNRRQKH